MIKSGETQSRAYHDRFYIYQEKQGGKLLLARSGRKSKGLIVDMIVTDQEIFFNKINPKAVITFRYLRYMLNTSASGWRNFEEAATAFAAAALVRPSETLNAERRRLGSTAVRRSSWLLGRSRLDRDLHPIKKGGLRAVAFPTPASRFHAAGQAARARLIAGAGGGWRPARSGGWQGKATRT